MTDYFLHCNLVVQRDANRSGSRRYFCFKAAPSGVRPFSTTSLQNASFEHPDDSTSILTFTQDLSEMSVSDSSTWTFAVGLPNNQWGGQHRISGSFHVSPTENCREIPYSTPSPTACGRCCSRWWDFSVAYRLPATTSGDTARPSISTTSVEANPPSVDAFASAANAGGSDGLVMLNATKPYKNLWMVHGMFMALAWGVCVFH